MVKGWIKSKIEDGTYVPNQRISSESELMKKFRVSRHTVRIAIAELVNEGWLYTEQGAGTFCARRSVQDQPVSSENRQKKVAIVTTFISDYIFPSIIRGAESEISKKGYQVSLFSTNNDYDNEKRILETIISHQYDGAIIEPTRSASSNPNIRHYLNLETMGIPYVMINAFYEEIEPVSIVLDDEKGGFLQTEHLINLGHRDIAGFFKTDDLQGVKRMKGFLKALRKYDIPINPNHIITYSTTEKTFKPIEEFKAMLDSPEGKPSGIVCYNDELVILLLHVVRERGISVPKDLSIVGYDDSFLSDITEVKLTTIEHPKSEMGKKAANMILRMIENNGQLDEGFESYVFDPKLVIRESAALIGSEKYKNKEII
jgi:GntR family transcriptional regulator of arabinose operon